MVEQLTLNQLVQGSSPWRITKYGGFDAANPHIWGFEPAKSAGSLFLVQFGAVENQGFTALLTFLLFGVAQLGSGLPVYSLFRLPPPGFRCKGVRRCPG
jgi:hypothetical protein